MYRNTYQKGCMSVFYSVGSAPLSNWSLSVKNGYTKRIFDDDIRSMVMELMGTNVSTVYMCCPREPRMTLGIKLPFLVLLIKNMHKYFTFEVKIMDDSNFARRFRVSNFQSKTTVKPFCTQMPMGMSPGWNQIHFNLADFTRRAYGTSYMEALRLQVHGNARIRRIYFTDHLYTEDDLPNEYRLVPRRKQGMRESFKAYRVPEQRPPSPAAKSTKMAASGATVTPISEDPIDLDYEEEYDYEDEYDMREIPETQNTQETDEIDMGQMMSPPASVQPPTEELHTETEEIKADAATEEAEEA